MSDWTFVVAAYGLAWMVLAGYAYTLESRLRGARGELDRTMADAAATSAPAAAHGGRPDGTGAGAVAPATHGQERSQ